MTLMEKKGSSLPLTLSASARVNGRLDPLSHEQTAINKSTDGQHKMELSSNMSSITQRDQALSILDSKLNLLSKLYKECYLSMGKGALLVYATDVIARGLPNEHDYRTKEEMLDVFDAPASVSKLTEMINNYDHKKEGILALITGYSNATYFVTVKLK